MRKKEFENVGGGATLLDRQDKGFGGIGYVKLLRYYDTKALRGNSRHGKSDLQYVILNLFQDLKKIRSRNKSGMTEVSCHPEGEALA